MSIENAIVAVIEGLIASGDALWAGVQVCDTFHVPITGDAAVRIGSLEAEVAPNEGQTEAIFYNAVVPLEFLVKVVADDRRNRAEARDKATRLALSFTKKVFDDPKLGGAVFDAVVPSLTNGFAAYRSTPFAVSAVPLFCNQTGEYLQGV